jgi:hypothetical protein
MPICFTLRVTVSTSQHPTANTTTTADKKCVTDICHNVVVNPRLSYCNGCWQVRKDSKKITLPDKAVVVKKHVVFFFVRVLRPHGFYTSGFFTVISPSRTFQSVPLSCQEHLHGIYSNQIRQLIPSWFLVVDSGAQVHVLLTLIMLDNVQDGGQRLIKWGGKGHHDR